MTCQTRHVLRQQLPEVILKPLTHKGVEHGADATIQERYVSGHVQRIVQSFDLNAHRVCFVGCGDLNGLQQDHDVIGSPANEEGEHDDEYQLHRAPFLPHASGHDPHGDAGVAVHHNEEGQQEEEEELHVVADQIPLFDDVGVVSCLLTHQALLAVLPHAFEHQLIETGQHTDEPNDQRRPDGVRPPPALGSGHRVHHGQVAVKGHQGEEEDGTVETDQMGTADQLAKHRAEDPLGGMVFGQEGEAGCKQDVRGDQIDEEDVSDAVDLLKLDDDEQNKPVAQVTQEEVDVVEIRNDGRAQLVDV